MSFFKKIGQWLEAKFKNVPTIEVQISSAVNYCVPYVEMLDTLVAPEVAVVVNPILDKIKTGFAALAVTITGSTVAGGAAAAVKSIAASITINIASLESAMQIKDAATQQKITAIVTLLNGEITDIVAGLPAGS